ncbi:hypothetical protein OG196_22955 [Kitasatospora purpeofusca]|uniref:hypothetical protein n=1 Tax=Kitasatospora purpeofusca TaxID=67352 RepID=UPI002E102269|nr:hypothetical protein OG196_22955 [Kitasatospora purpeofusca]
MTTTTRKRLPVVRDVTRTVFAYGGRMAPRHLTVHEARTAIRSWRRDEATVHVYRTTDRDGVDLHVVYVRSAPGYWSGGEITVDVFEIPTATLLAL